MRLLDGLGALANNPTPLRRWHVGSDPDRAGPRARGDGHRPVTVNIQAAAIDGSLPGSYAISNTSKAAVLP